jgi:glycosyltransferase involved in cell wall biosynthesis
MARILFLGENWYGSCARACAYALRRLGHNVADVDLQTFFPQATTLRGRATRRATERVWREAYNDAVLEVGRAFDPDIVLAFKGNALSAASVVALRERGARTYNYYPDLVERVVGTPEARALAEYDCFFDTKARTSASAVHALGLRAREHVSHGYDPDVHRALHVPREDHERLASRVSFIGGWAPRKERMLSELLRIAPEIDLTIRGRLWDRCRDPRVRARARVASLLGDDYARAIAAADVNLALLGVDDRLRDETTTRTYEIPACGGFMLHERTPELAELFVEGREVACFGDARELAAKIEHYLAHPDEREAIARAGHARCVPAYSYDERMARILDWDKAHSA